LGDESKTEMGGACSYMGDRGAYRVLVGKPEEKNHLENPGTDERTTLKWIFKKWEWGTAWIDLSQERERWQALVYVVMNLQVP